MNLEHKAISILISMMLIAIISIPAMAFTAPNANDERVEIVIGNEPYSYNGLYINDNSTCQTDESTLRIYGEMIPGNLASTDAAFPYTDAEAPFDPTNDERPEKDFVVFNPAYMPGNYLDRSISVDTIPGVGGITNAREKVFVRQWYVPDYPEPRGMVWTTQATIPSEDIVTEYTYMLLDSNNKPVAGYAGDSHGTNFWLPIGMSNGQIGLDSFSVSQQSAVENEILELIEVGDFNGDGLKDINVATKDTITIDDGSQPPFWIVFMDHAIHVRGITATSVDEFFILCDIYYTGNSFDFANPASSELVVQNLELEVGGQNVIAGRHGYNTELNPRFDMPWYLEVSSVGWHSQDDFSVCIHVGRLLHMGETFFVNGAEYDIAMIYGPDAENFKYITIRNPIPKEDAVTLGALTITKESIDVCDQLPMLPPFNMEHIMVDDINIPCDCPPCVDCDEMSPNMCSILPAYDEVDERLISHVPALDIHYVEETVEPRFYTTLGEVFDVEAYEDCSTCNIWNWIRTQTMPNQYTEMKYPSLPDIDSGNGDFLMVSSWEAPNSCENRVKFSYDAENSKDIYVNDDDEFEGEIYKTVRIYGEDSIDAAFPYTDPEGPFNKLSDDAPGKDFVTFNPAYYGAGAGVMIDDDLGREKVFVRQWYVPEYPGPRGMVWTQQSTVTSPDIVTEYTFMLLTEDNNPVAGTAGDTMFKFPTGSGGVPGLNNHIVNVDDNVNTMAVLREVGDFNGDSLKDINIMSEEILLSSLSENDRLRFLDHEIQVTDISSQELTVDVYYIGNDAREPVANGVVLDACGDKLSSGRNLEANSVVLGRDPAFNHPWYAEIVCDGPVYNVVVGRLLHMGETFFVDAAEYDIAMIYGPNADDFMYITLRNPIPKNSDVTLHSLDITKDSIDEGEIIPMLPPLNFNNHGIVDDIGILNSCDSFSGVIIEPEEGSYIDIRYDEIDERIVWGNDALDIFFIEEEIEPRFTTNLLEILDEEDVEDWQWLHIITRPDHYTTMVYPDVNDKDKNNYVAEDADFILTTSGPKGYDNPCDEPYDTNEDCTIDFDEVMGAIQDYFNGSIDFDRVMEVIQLYYNSPYN